MRYTNKLNITLYSDNQMLVKIMHNGKETIVNTKNQIVHTVYLEPNIDHQITLEQLITEQQDFFYIKKVSLEQLDITELLHHNNTCLVVDKETQCKIGDFVEDIGVNDRVLLKINKNFYHIIFNNLSLIQVDQ